MRKIKRRTPPINLLLYYVCCLILGGFLGAYLSACLPDTAATLPWLLYIFLFFALAWLLHIPIHEGGHLLFGLMTGYRFQSFNVFGLVWLRGKDGRIRFARQSNRIIGGQCLLFPPPYNEGNHAYILYNLGGVLLNALTGLLALAAAILLFRKPLFFLPLASFSFVGIVSALMNGVPKEVGGIHNDGMNLREVRRNPEAKRAMWLQLRIAAEMAQGVPLREMPEEWFPALPPDNTLCSAIAVFRLNRQMEGSLGKETLSAIRRLLESDAVLLPMHRALLLCDGTVCELLLDAPPHFAPQLVTEAMRPQLKLMQGMLPVLRTNYALSLLRDGDETSAAKHLAAFEKAAKHYPYPQDADSERAIIALIRQKNGERTE